MTEVLCSDTQCEIHINEGLFYAKPGDEFSRHNLACWGGFDPYDCTVKVDGKKLNFQDSLVVDSSEMKISISGVRL